MSLGPRAHEPKDGAPIGRKSFRDDDQQSRGRRIAVAIMAAEIVGTQKAEEVNPAPPMVKDKHRMIQAGEQQRALKWKQTEVEEKPRPGSTLEESAAPAQGGEFWFLTDFGRQIRRS